VSKYILNFNGLRFTHFKGSGRLCSLMNNLTSPYLVKKYNPDLIHESYYNSVNESSKNTKKIITVHDMTHELFPNQFPKTEPKKDIKSEYLKPLALIISSIIIATAILLQ
jgi:hypothetical protein